MSRKSHARMVLSAFRTMLETNTYLRKTKKRHLNRFLLIITGLSSPNSSNCCIYFGNVAFTLASVPSDLPQHHKKRACRFDPTGSTQKIHCRTGVTTEYIPGHSVLFWRGKTVYPGVNPQTSEYIDEDFRERPFFIAADRITQTLFLQTASLLWKVIIAP